VTIFHEAATMVHIKITKGLDIPIEGSPSVKPNTLLTHGDVSLLAVAQQVALNLSTFDGLS